MLLLDSAAMGVNTVEREGISYAHPARFALIGTMNPEEGDTVRRSEIAARVLAYERDPASFHASYAAQEEAFGTMINRTRALLPRVEVPSAILHFVAACAARAACSRRDRRHAGAHARARYGARRAARRYCA